MLKLIILQNVFSLQYAYSFSLFPSCDTMKQGKIKSVKEWSI